MRYVRRERELQPRAGLRTPQPLPASRGARDARTRARSPFTPHARYHSTWVTVHSAYDVRRAQQQYRSPRSLCSHSGARALRPPCAYATLATALLPLPSHPRPARCCALNSCAAMAVSRQRLCCSRPCYCHRPTRLHMGVLTRSLAAVQYVRTMSMQAHRSYMSPGRVGSQPRSYSVGGQRVGPQPMGASVLGRSPSSPARPPPPLNAGPRRWPHRQVRP